MKKVFLLVICFFTLVVNAQEKKSGFALELGIGTSNYGNMSPISIFADPTAGYNLIASEYISVGYCNNGWFVGLTLDYDGGNTSFQNLNEKFFNINTMVDIRRYFKLNDMFELEAGLALGLLVHNNFFDYANEYYSYSRYGASGYAYMGLNYNLAQNRYIGIHVRYPYMGSFLDSKPTLPIGLEANNNTQMVGYSLQLSYGIKF